MMTRYETPEHTLKIETNVERRCWCSIFSDDTSSFCSYALFGRLIIHNNHVYYVASFGVVVEGNVQ
jgi:hypothetical protein